MPPAKLKGLSDREIEVLRLIALDRTTKEIVEELGISTGTVKRHREHINQKLNIHAPAGIVLYAIHHNHVKREEIHDYLSRRQAAPVHGER